MPNLQELHLSPLTVDDADALMQFGPFTAVTQLRFEGLIVSPQDPGQASKSALTNPEAQVVDKTAAVLELLEPMTQMQRLHLVVGKLDREPWMAAAVPTTVTALHLALNVGWNVSPCVPTGLLQLVDLQALHLKLGGGIDPDIIAGMSRLQMLTLKVCMYPPSSAGVAGPDALLAAVERLPQIRHLSLPEGEPACSLAAAQPSSCAALTACSRLTHFEVIGKYTLPLPTAALQHLSPPISTFPQLRRLFLGCKHPGIPIGQLLYITEADIACFISACPNLNSLDIKGALQPGDNCSPLLKLPETCRELCVGGEAFANQLVITLGITNW